MPENHFSVTGRSSRHFGALRATKLVPLLLLCALPATLPAQDYTYTTNNGTITITGYTGSGGAVTIPGTINGLAVTSIGDYAFYYGISLTSVMVPGSVISIGSNAFDSCTSLTNVTLPNSVTNIENYTFQGCTSLSGVTMGNSVISIRAGAFRYCRSLTSVTIPASVTSIGSVTFSDCASLTNVTIPGSVTNIGDYAFQYCSSLTGITVDALNSFYSSVGGVLFDKSQTALIQYPGAKAGGYTIPDRVTNIGNGAFEFCTNLTSVTTPSGVTGIGDFAFAESSSLTGVYFRGNAPGLGSYVFYGANNTTVYYLPSTAGWGTTFGGVPALLWRPQIQTGDASFGVRTNQFGFNMTWASGMTVVVDACTNLTNPIWVPLQTNTLTSGASYFSDPQWTNYRSRFYRLRWP